MMAQTNINIRMDETLKKQFDHLCSELGLNMSTAFTVLLKLWFVNKKFLLKSLSILLLLMMWIMTESLVNRFPTAEKGG